jgi:hypothetical protein
MSPEQINGAGIDHRTDVFALTAVLWECLAGQAPFTGTTAPDIIASILESRLVAPLRELNPSLDERFVAFVEKGLAVVPEARHQSAALLERDLRAYLALRHPGFTRRDLATFVQEVMGAEREARQQDIRQVIEAAAPAPGAADAPPKLPSLATRLKQSAELWLDLASQRLSRHHLDPADADPDGSVVLHLDDAPEAAPPAQARAADNADAGFRPDLSADPAAPTPSLVAPGRVTPRANRAAHYQQHNGTLRTLPSNTYRHARKMMMRAQRRRRLKSLLKATVVLGALAACAWYFVSPGTGTPADRFRAMLRQGRSIPQLQMLIGSPRRRPPRFQPVSANAERPRRAETEPVRRPEKP